MTREQRKGILWGLLLAGLLGAAIFVGSCNLRHIDADVLAARLAVVLLASSGSPWPRGR